MARVRGPLPPASREVHRAPGHCMSGGPRYVGLPAVRGPRRFRRAPRVSRPTVPRNFRCGFIPSCVPSSSEFLRLPTGPRLAVRLRPAGGFFPLRGFTGRRPRARRIPSLRYVPSSGFLNLSTACSATRLCGLVSSHSHVQGFRSGVCSPQAAVPTHRRPCPLALTAVPLTGFPATTTRRPDFEALIRWAIRTPKINIACYHRTGTDWVPEY